MASLSALSLALACLSLTSVSGMVEGEKVLAVPFRVSRSGEAEDGVVAGGAPPADSPGAKPQGKVGQRRKGDEAVEIF